MGDIADMDADSMWVDDYYSYPHYIENPKCKGCGTTHVRWGKYKTKWILVNDNDAPHRCKKYELPIEVMKDLALENLKRQKKIKSDRIFQKSMGYNGIKRVVNELVTNEQLLDLYTRWVDYSAKDACNNSGGFRIYDNKVLELKQELLKRLK